MLDGTVRIFIAESLILPTGLLTVAFLTRKLGPENYGLYTLAAAIASWLCWTVTSIYSRAAIKFVSEADNWRPVGAFVLKLSLAAGLGVGLCVFLLAPPLAQWLKTPTLAPYLQLFSVEILFVSLANAHKTILTGLGGFRERAVISSSHWIIRLFLIIVFVELGFSVAGAVMGSVAASLVELLVSRWYVRPSISGGGKFAIRQFWSYSLPLLLFVLIMRLFDKVDLFALKALGRSTAEVGIYAAAQNLTLVPGIFAFSFSTPLLTIVSRLLHSGRTEEAKELARSAMRVVIILLPFAGLCVGAASEIVALIFGESFLPAAPLLSLLIFASLALVMVSITSAILTAAGKPGWTIALTAPVLPFALGGYILLIPHFGALGAAMVTTSIAILDSVAAVLLVYWLWNILPPFASLWRSILVGFITFALATFWQAEGFWLLFKLSAIGSIIVCLYLLLGEFKAKDIALVRSTFWRQTGTNQNPNNT